MYATSLYIVLAILVAKSDKIADLKAELTTIGNLSKQEPTCHEYRVHQDINKPELFVLYEAWQSKEAHTEQFTKPYILSLAQKLDDLLAEPYQVMFVQEL